MISIIPGYRNRNLLVKWINSHQHHTWVYMGTVLFPFSRVTHCEYCEVCHPYSVSQYCTKMTCARVHLSTYGNIVMPCWSKRSESHQTLRWMPILACQLQKSNGGPNRCGQGGKHQSHSFVLRPVFHGPQDPLPDCTNGKGIGGYSNKWGR
jgi:hypothetical protein